MSTALGTPHAGPGVARQIVRAAVGTLTVVAVLVGATALVVNGARPAAGMWWSVVGDRDVFVGEGVVLPETAPVTSVPAMTARAWSLADDLAAITAPLGGSAQLVSTRAQLAAAAPWFEEGDGLDARPLQAPTAVLPAGVLRLMPGVMGPTSTVLFAGGPDAPVATTAEAQKALVVELEKAWGVGGSGGLLVTPYRWDTESDLSSLYSVRLTLPDCSICDVVTYDNVAFDADGRLMRAQFYAMEITGARPLELLGAAQVFEDIRHHRGDWYVETGGNPIMGARLQVADVTVPEGIVTWQFEDGNGSVVAMYPADPEFIPVGGGMPWQDGE